MTKRLTIILLLLLSFLTTFGQVENDDYWQNIPKQTGWVNDFENIFTQEQIKKLDSLTADYEKQTTIEIVVITIPANATKKENFDELILLIANNWGVGKKENRGKHLNSYISSL